MDKKTFDQTIRNNLVRLIGEDKFGYESGKTYENYYSKVEFEKFKTDMKSSYPQAFEAYSEGKGSELSEQIKPYGIVPPKMASVASSSRFCYLALKDGAEALGGSGTVTFEHACRIKGIRGTAPQMDAYIPNENIYVEAKCHEIFDSHCIKMPKAYGDLIYGKNNDFGFDGDENLVGNAFTIPLSEFGIDKSSTMFDIKQFLCHLLGIASRENRDEPATLFYLFFKPEAEEKDVAQQIEEVFSELCCEIEKIYQSAPIQSFIKKNHIQLVAAFEQSKVMEKLTIENLKIICKA